MKIFPCINNGTMMQGTYWVMNLCNLWLLFAGVLANEIEFGPN